MRVVTWNCNGALRKKFHILQDLEADIYIVQECEDPLRTTSSEYKQFSKNHLWIGENKNKGLGIFAEPSLRLEKLQWTNTYKDHSVRYFLPCKVNGLFDLLGVWTHKNNSPNFGYIGQFWKYLQINLEKCDNVLIAGDFNSNVIWDQWDRWWNHSDVVKILNQKAIQSLYHLSTSEEQGRESKPTFYLHRKLEKPYHIDYMFGAPRFTSHLEALIIGSQNVWLNFSDHLPIISDFKFENTAK